MQEWSVRQEEREREKEILDAGKGGVEGKRNIDGRGEGEKE